MRRLFAAAVLTALAAVLTACGGESDSGGTGSTAQGQDTAANTQQVCTAAQKVVTDSTTKFTQELTKSLTAAATGDKSVTGTAVKSVKDLFTVWADGIRAEAEKALDPELKTALTTMADGLVKVQSSITSFDDLQKADKLLDSAELNAADQKLTQLCGS
jgi:hypothetical protein